METGYTIVVDNQDNLSCLCGVNDGNLRTIENYLGVPVVSRGNELTVASTDEAVCRKFQVIIEKVLFSNEIIASPEMLEAFFATFEQEYSTTDSFIQIPHGLKRVYPKTVKQAELIQRLQRSDIVFAVGPAGTGKTFLAVAEALHLVLTHQMRKIILTRPVVEAGESLGFLPGDLEQKINPYLRPLRDAMETLLPPDILKKMEDSRMIEIAPLAYMRGRTLDHCVIILDEAQNTTKEQMKMFLTRLGEGARAIITGDPSQTDLLGRTESGLSHAMKILQHISEIAVVRMEDRDVIRHPLVKKIVQAYDQKKE